MTGPATPQGGLRRLLERITPTEWVVDKQPASPLRVLATDDRQTIICTVSGSAENPWSKAEAPLIALAPEVAALLCDMAAEIDEELDYRRATTSSYPDTWPSLLARFRALNDKAGQP